MEPFTLYEAWNSPPAIDFNCLTMDFGLMLKQRLDDAGHEEGGVYPRHQRYVQRPAEEEDEEIDVLAWQPGSTKDRPQRSIDRKTERAVVQSVRNLLGTGGAGAGMRKGPALASSSAAAPLHERKVLRTHPTAHEFHGLPSDGLDKVVANPIASAYAQHEHASADPVPVPDTPHMAVGHFDVQYVVHSDSEHPHLYLPPAGEVVNKFGEAPHG